MHGSIYGNWSVHGVKNKCLKININVYEVLCICKLWNLIYVCGQYTATQKKRSRTFSYVFWGVESEFEVKIAPYPLSFGDNFKNRYFIVNIMEKYGMIMRGGNFWGKFSIKI